MLFQGLVETFAEATVSIDDTVTVHGQAVDLVVLVPHGHRGEHGDLERASVHVLHARRAVSLFLPCSVVYSRVVQGLNVIGRPFAL